MKKGVERRKYPRAYFTVKDGITGLFELPGSEKFTMSTNILSLSEGGISFIGQKEAMENVKIEDGILLVRVFEPTKLHFLNNVFIHVRHTINEPDMGHVLCGCRFANLSEEQKSEIGKFVKNWLESLK